MIFRILIVIISVNLTLSAQSDVAAVNDSILKYIIINPPAALNFGLNYLKSHPELSPSKEVVNLNYNLGEVLLKQGNYPESLRYLARSLTAYEQLEISERSHKAVNKPPWLLVAMGNVYFHNNFLDRAQDYYEEARQNFELYSEEYETERIFGINAVDGNMALIEIRKSNFKKAEEILNSIYQRRLLSEKKSDLLYSYLQFMQLYIALDDSIRATEYLRLIEIESNFEKEVNEEQTLSESAYVLAKGYSDYGGMLLTDAAFEEAIFYYNKALALTDNLAQERVQAKIALANANLGLEKFDEANQIILELLQAEELNFSDKLLAYKTLQQLYSDTDNLQASLVAKDSVISILNNPEYRNLIVDDLGLVEQNLNEIEKEVAVAEEKLRYNTFMFTLVICILVLVFTLISLRINYKFQKEKTVRLELEKGAIESELKLKERELVGKASFINQRNEYIKRIQTKIEEHPTDASLIQEIKAELKNILNSERIYEEFEKSLGSVYPEFYKKLKSYSSISSTDMRLAAFIKMNYDNSEIAKLSGLSIRSVESQRYRLSKKLDLPKGQSLNDFIQNI